MIRLGRLLIVLLVLALPGCLVVTCGTTRTIEPDEQEVGGAREGSTVDSSRGGTSW